MFHEALVLGKTYTAEDGYEAGIFHRTADSACLMNETIRLAREILPKGGHKRQYLDIMKTSTYQQIVNELCQSFKGKFNIMSLL